MWTCPKCHEENDDEADVCFSCGTSSEGEEDPEFRKADDVGAEYEGDRPLVEVLPETIIPEALQPREPKPVPRPRWRAVVCPHCGSRNLASDRGASWLSAGAWLVVCLLFVDRLLGAHVAPVVCGITIIVVLLACLAPYFTTNAWCRDCGVRFKKLDRLERPAEESPQEPGA